ncbi:hypothetical protein [Enterobacter hormaechei]|uniref:hypothetical protein n=1 Tax=Enterobacter hormaechei TaxID=158836 RepID=UPI00177F6A6D|nr:hypothetical protein [Enterobacter hormaechei]MBD8848800.1 hypothetical protein [Enterobacter hormaechei]
MTLTKEWLLKTISELEEERDAVPGVVNVDAAKALAAMKLALASLEADGTLANEGNITATQFKPVADLYEVTVPSGRSTTFTKDAAEASDCRVMGWHVQEYVKLERYQAAMLQGAEPVTTAYKLRDAVEIIRNSGIEIDAEKIFAERDTLNTPDCWCRTCRPVTVTDMRFVVCPDCGNKRCPHANDHRNACTGSNEPGQEGSAYPAAPQQEVK